MEGANLSGDLKDPARSIPTGAAGRSRCIVPWWERAGEETARRLTAAGPSPGTLAALLTAFVIYAMLILSMGGAFDGHELRIDQNVFQNSTLGSKFIVVVGIIISAISSALGSLFGGSRVLQAMARDDLFPVFSWFKYGSKHGDEPRTAVIFTWLVAQVRGQAGQRPAAAARSEADRCAGR
jgi:amino acid transporter